MNVTTKSAVDIVDIDKTMLFPSSFCTCKNGINYKEAYFVEGFEET